MNCCAHLSSARALSSLSTSSSSSSSSSAKKSYGSTNSFFTNRGRNTIINKNRNARNINKNQRLVVVKAGVVEDIASAIEQNKKDVARREEMKYQSPPGVPPPPIVPVIEPGKFGFVDNAETMNSRASMIGWWSLLLVELVAGKGLLEMLGFTVGKGINFTF
jgi:cytoskeletal protein RodZ